MQGSNSVLEFVRGFGRAIHHLALATGASAIATGAWALRDQIAQGLTQLVAFVQSVVWIIWSAVLWLWPYRIYDTVTPLVGALGSALEALLAWARGALAALAALLVPSPPPPPPDTPTTKEMPPPPPPPAPGLLTMKDTLVDAAGFKSERVRFAVFPADCVWPTKRSDAPVCGGPTNRSTDAFAAALKEAVAEFGYGSTPRMVAFGLASCDGESLADNDKLAEQRARRLAELLGQANLGPQGIISVSFGQFRATNCNRSDEKWLMSQRPIVAAGIYGDLRSKEQLEALLKFALEKHDPSLPQPKHYSQFRVLP